MPYQITLLLLLFFLPFLSFSQNASYELGTIYLPNGKEKTGYIKRTDFKKLGDKIYFKETLEEKEEQFTPYEIDGFKFESDHTKFKKTSFYLLGMDENSETEKTYQDRFARIIVKSAIDLYKVELKRNEYNADVIGSVDYLYIASKSKDTLQLDLLQSRRNGISQEVTERYRGILKYLFSDCPSVRTERIQFGDKPIIDAVLKYNDCIGSNIEVEMLSDGRKIILDHRIQVNYSQTNDKAYENFFSANLGYALSFYSPEVSKRFGATVGANIVFQNYYWTLLQDDFSLQHLNPFFLIDITIFDQIKHKLSVQTGLSIYSNLKTNLDVTQNSFFVSSYTLFPVNLVYDYQSLRFLIGYHFQPETLNTVNNILNIGFGYRLN